MKARAISIPDPITSTALKALMLAIALLFAGFVSIAGAQEPVSRVSGSEHVLTGTVQAPPVADRSTG